MKKILYCLLLTITFFTTTCFGEETVVIKNPNTFDPNMEYISDINLPGIVSYDYGGGNELLIIAKNIFNRALEYLPMLVLILLLLACLKIIIEGDGKEGFKRIKYILIGVAIMILSIYIMNIASSIISGHPLINIQLNKFY